MRSRALTCSESLVSVAIKIAGYRSIRRYLRRTGEYGASLSNDGFCCGRKSGRPRAEDQAEGPARQLRSFEIELQLDILQSSRQPSQCCTNTIRLLRQHQDGCSGSLPYVSIWCLHSVPASICPSTAIRTPSAMCSQCKEEASQWTLSDRLRFSKRRVQLPEFHKGLLLRQHLP